MWEKKFIHLFVARKMKPRSNRNQWAEVTARPWQMQIRSHFQCRCNQPPIMVEIVKYSYIISLATALWFKTVLLKCVRLWQNLIFSQQTKYQAPPADIDYFAVDPQSRQTQLKIKLKSLKHCSLRCVGPYLTFCFQVFLLHDVRSRNQLLI